jgi:hypothetical protein
LIRIRIFFHEVNDAARGVTREDRNRAIEGRSRCVERMFRRASSPPAFSPSIYRREMNVGASLAQGLGHVASTRPSLGLPNNSGLLRGNPGQWRILPQRSGTILRRQVLLRGVRVARHLRRYIAAPRPTGSVRIGQSLSETDNRARLTSRAIVRNGQSRCPSTCIVAESWSNNERRLNCQKKQSLSDHMREVYAMPALLHPATPQRAQEPGSRMRTLLVVS